MSSYMQVERVAINIDKFELFIVFEVIMCGSPIQYGGQVNLINFYKPRPLYYILHFDFFF